MDLYTTIVGLYSQNRHEVLRVVNTAIHSKCNLSEGIEVIHTGFYCFTHTGKELEFLYDTQSQIFYFIPPLLRFPDHKRGGGNVTIWDQRKNLRDFISMHIIFVQFLIERVSDLTIAYLFYIISTFTKDIRKQSPIT